MLKNYVRVALCATMIGLAATACGGDDDKSSTEPPVSTDDIDKPGNTSELMTPSEAKDFLDKTAVEFMSKIRTADQKDVITLGHYFMDTYGDLDAPEEFNVDAVESNSPRAAAVRTLMHDLTAAVESYDASGIASSIVTYTYNVGFKQFTGVYEAGMSRWVKRDNSDKIVFRFDGATGSKCELTIAASSTSSDLSHTVTDEYEDYIYDPYTGSYSYVTNEEQTTVNISLPREITFTLTEGSNQLAKGVVKTDLNIAGHTMAINADVTVANINVVLNTSGQDSQIEQTATLSLSGSRVISSSATIKGHNLCNKDYIVSLMEKDDLTDDDMLALFTSGSATVDLMGKVQLVGAVDIDRKLIKAIRGSGNWDSYEYDLKLDAENDVNEAVAALTEKARFVMRFNGSSTNQAKIVWKSTFENVYSYWYFDIEPLMQFNSDSMTYSFDEYFEVGFSDSEKQFNNLLSTYEKLWESTGK